MIQQEKKKFTQEDYNIVLQISIIEYLESIAYPIKREGVRARDLKIDSLVFLGNGYIRNSTKEAGTILDFLIKYLNYDFVQAMYKLLEYSGKFQSNKYVISDLNKEICKLSDFEILPRNEMKQTYGYLCNYRKIDRKIVNELIEKKLIFQEKIHNNILFPIYDENNEFVGAELQGSLSDQRFKGLSPSVKYGYGFNTGFGKNYKYILFFESAIDLISFIEIERFKNKYLENCLLVSLSGIKENIYNHMYKVYSSENEQLQPVLCVDNDSAGESFIKRIKALNEAVIVLKPDISFKDWNEQLKNMKL
jgi:hypothetical protein